MTARALLTADDAKRLTDAAKASGCAIVVSVKADVRTVTIIPDGHSLKNTLVDTEPADPPLSLESWRKSRGQNKGSRRA